MAWFSAIANDFAYEDVFVEQLRTILRKGDVLIVISASGTLFSTWLTLTAMEFTWPGVPVTAWASMRPSVS